MTFPRAGPWEKPAHPTHRRWENLTIVYSSYTTEPPTSRICDLNLITESPSAGLESSMAWLYQQGKSCFKNLIPLSIMKGFHCMCGTVKIPWGTLGTQQAPQLIHTFQGLVGSLSTLSSHFVGFLNFYVYTVLSACVYEHCMHVLAANTIEG